MLIITAIFDSPSRVSTYLASLFEPEFVVHARLIQD